MACRTLLADRFPAAMRPALAFALLLPLLGGCLGEAEYPSIPMPPMPEDRHAGKSVSILVAGDTGTQLPDQYDTAKAMQKVCERRGCDFAMGLGDNIYMVGPLVGTSDPQFQTAFEMPYADLDLTWYFTLGNHDDGLTGHIVANGDWEVAYTHSAQSSGKWQMPSRYYNQTFNDDFLEIWSIDGDVLNAEGIQGIRLGPDLLYDRQEQIGWMKESIGKSEARWKVVFGHYQYSTEGYKGDGDPVFKDSLEQFMCDQAQFYFYGHQHQLRWEAPIDSCGRTEFINSGAGARAEGEPTPEPDLGIEEYFVHKDSAGFWWIEFDGDLMTAIAYGVGADDPTEPVELFGRAVTRQGLGWDAPEPRASLLGLPGGPGPARATEAVGLEVHGGRSG
jgi:tartrate-resistant acid phosphatase type 5